MQQIITDKDKTRQISVRSRRRRPFGY